MTASARSLPVRPSRPQLVAIVAVAIHAIWLILQIGGVDRTNAFSNVTSVAAPGAAAIACAATARRGRDRPLVWWLLGAACAMWMLGSLTWTFYELVLDRAAPFPSIADVGYLGMYPLALAALLLSVPGRVRTISSVRSVLDGLVVGASLLFASWALVLGPAIDERGIGALERAVLVAYPLADVVLVTVALASPGGVRLLRRGGFPLLVGGLVAIAVSDSLFLYLTASDDYASGSLIDIGWFGGFALIALAARDGHVAVRADTDRAAPATGNLRIYIPTLLVVFGQARSRLDPFVAVIGASVLLLVVVRQVLANLETKALNRDLGLHIKELNRRDEQFGLVVRATRDAIWDLNIADDTVTWGDGVQELFGHAPSPIANDFHWWVDHVHPDDRSRVEAGVHAAIEQGDAAWTDEYRFVRADGQWADVVDRGFIVRDSDGTPTRMVGAMMDVTDRKQFEHELAHRALHDPLTALPNRTFVTDRIRAAIDGGRARSIALFFLDLDHFKRVNDSYGHAAGDEVLVEVADRLRAAVRGDDVVARFGGDEFVILCTDIGSDVGAVEIVDRMHAALGQPFVTGGRQVHLSASIGVALGRDVGTSAEDLLQSVDTALYEAKAQGRARHVVFNEVLSSRVRKHLELTESLRHALRNEELSVHYQPIIELESRAVVGVEALARWRLDRSFISPAEFIPLAEEAGLIGALGTWVLEHSCTEVASWDVSRSGDFQLSVNVSPLQLTETLAAEVQEILDRSGLRPARLCLEITEGALMTDPSRSLAVLHELRRAGIRLAIDDFGTGYSSLSYLRHLPIHSLKIDRSFVNDVGQDRGNDGIIQAVVGIARPNALTVVAEGVELGSQARRLAELGCDQAQGYLFGQPKPGPVLRAKLDEPRPRSARAEADRPHVIRSPE